MQPRDFRRVRRFLFHDDSILMTSALRSSCNIAVILFLASLQVQSTCVTVTYWVTHSPRNTDNVGSIPGTGRYIVSRMTT